MDKPDCYKCIHRGNTPGDAHSCCRHPKVGDDPFAAILTMLSTGGAVANELNIKGNEYGVQSGWFLWPANFDPVWLESCDGFEGNDK